MALMIACSGIGSHRPFRKVQQLFLFHRRCRQKLVPGSVYPHINELPVIKSGALEMPVIDFKSQWFYQMERGQRSCAKPGYATGVRWDLGLK
jgi:hypothetical protein